MSAGCFCKSSENYSEGKTPTIPIVSNLFLIGTWTTAGCCCKSSENYSVSKTLTIPIVSKLCPYRYVDDCGMLLQEFIEAAVKPGHRKAFSTTAPLIKYQAINIAPHQQTYPPSGGGGAYLDRPPKIK